MKEPGDGGGWVLHVARREGHDAPGPPPAEARARSREESGRPVSTGGPMSAGDSLSELVRALASLGLRQAAAVPGDGRLAGALDGRVALLRPSLLPVARALRRRPDPSTAEVRWPEVGPVPVLHAHDPAALRVAWLALCLTGAPARLTALWTAASPPPAPPWSGLWRRCDAVMASSPAAARALRSVGVAGRRIRRLDPEAPAEGLLAVYGELSRAPALQARRVDWSLRPPSDRRESAGPPPERRPRAGHP